MPSSGPPLRHRLIDVVARIKRDLDLPDGLDIRFVSNATGEAVLRHTKVETQGLETLRDRVDERTRVASLCAEIGRICGAQLNTRVEMTWAGQPLNGRLSIGRLSMGRLRQPRPSRAKRPSDMPLLAFAEAKAA